jgi:hypothetical protein
MDKIRYTLPGKKGQMELNLGYFTEEMTWNEANEKSRILEGSWRMPDIDEFKEIFNHLGDLHQTDFGSYTYWTSSEYDHEYAWVFSARYKSSYANAPKKNRYLVPLIREIA